MTQQAPEAGEICLTERAAQVRTVFLAWSLASVVTEHLADDYNLQ